MQHIFLASLIQLRTWKRWKKYAAFSAFPKNIGKKKCSFERSGDMFSRTFGSLFVKMLFVHHHDSETGLLSLICPNESRFELLQMLPFCSLYGLRCHINSICMRTWKLVAPMPAKHDACSLCHNHEIEVCQNILHLIKNSSKNCPFATQSNEYASSNEYQKSALHRLLL